MNPDLIRGPCEPSRKGCPPDFALTAAKPPPLFRRIEITSAGSASCSPFFFGAARLQRPRFHPRRTFSGITAAARNPRAGADVDRRPPPYLARRSADRRADRAWCGDRSAFGTRGPPEPSRINVVHAAHAERNAIAFRHTNAGRTISSRFRRPPRRQGLLLVVRTHRGGRSVSSCRASVRARSPRPDRGVDRARPNVPPKNRSGTRAHQNRSASSFERASSDTSCDRTGISVSAASGRSKRHRRRGERGTSPCGRVLTARRQLVVCGSR